MLACSLMHSLTQKLSQYVCSCNKYLDDSELDKSWCEADDLVGMQVGVLSMLIPENTQKMVIIIEMAVWCTWEQAEKACLSRQHLSMLGHSREWQHDSPARQK